jgi:hypothetical protein
MRKQSLFSKERNIYWSEEFADVVNQLTGRDSEGRLVSVSLYPFNTGAIALASAVGIKFNRKTEVASDRRKEISTNTFAAHGFEPYIFLVSLVASPSISLDVLRPENEEGLIREYERYVAGGLEILRGEFDASGGQTCDVIVQRLMLDSSTIRDETNLVRPSLL